MTRSERLRDFIKEVLGCNCPDSALAHIRLDRHPAEIAGVPLTLRISIAGRLLVHVVCTDEPGELVESLDAVFDAGRRLRDDNGFNRFRFVVGTRAPTDARDALMAAFLALPHRDARQHLHVVSMDDVPAPSADRRVAGRSRRELKRTDQRV